MTDRTDDDSAMTTHSEWGSGAPHLLVSRGGEDRSIYDLTSDEVTIGSAEGSSLVLPGTDAVHATIVHDDRDEYVLTLHGAGEMNASTDAAQDGVRSEVLKRVWRLFKENGIELPFPQLDVYLRESAPLRQLVGAVARRGTAEGEEPS